MNWLTINLSDTTAESVRNLVGQIINGSVEAGTTSIQLPVEFKQIIHRFTDHVEMLWSPALEADVPRIPIVNPDVIKVSLHRDRAIVSLRLGTITISYGEAD